VVSEWLAFISSFDELLLFLEITSMPSHSRNPSQVDETIVITYTVLRVWAVVPVEGRRIHPLVTHWTTHLNGTVRDANLGTD
jgi:hypothetical protein